jgi:chemotaxis protein MotB
MNLRSSFKQLLFLSLFWSKPLLIMRRTNFLPYMAVCVAVFAFSCVPARKFKELQNDAQNCENVRQSLRIENEKLSVENNELKDKLSRCGRERDSLRYDSILLVSQKNDLERNNQKLKGLYNDLQDAQQSMLRNNSRETTKLLQQLQITQSDLQKKEDTLRIREAALKAKENALLDKEKNISQLNGELGERDARIRELENVLARNDSAVKSLRNKVTDALTGFEGKGLSINIRNGKVYVSLEEKLLFRSGSYDVDPKGLEALKQLAVVLEQNKDINIMIEGHTDDVPLRSTTAVKDNWDLSVMRATTIVKAILKSGKIEPTRLTAAGRGQFFPVDPAKTAEARQKNRRTEIILTPKLDELFKILGSN